jgi:hypothetical protein
MTSCKICGKKVRSSGLCYAHYERKRRYGDPEAKPPMGPKKGALRLYLERTGEWNRMLAYTSPQSRKKYHKAVNKLFALLRRPRPLGVCDEDENATIEMAMSLAAIIAFDENTQTWNFSDLERTVDTLYEAKDWLEQLKTLSCGAIS